LSDNEGNFSDQDLPESDRSEIDEAERAEDAEDNDEHADEHVADEPAENNEQDDEDHEEEEVEEDEPPRKRRRVVRDQVQAAVDMPSIVEQIKDKMARIKSDAKLVQVLAVLLGLHQVDNDGDDKGGTHGYFWDQDALNKIVDAINRYFCIVINEAELKIVELVHVNAAAAGSPEDEKLNFAMMPVGDGGQDVDSSASSAAGSSSAAFSSSSSVSSSASPSVDLIIISCSCYLYTKAQFRDRFSTWHVPAHWLRAEDRRHSAAPPPSASSSAAASVSLIDLWLNHTEHRTSRVAASAAALVK
jgi:hypothetical protein